MYNFLLFSPFQDYMHRTEKMVRSMSPKRHQSYITKYLCSIIFGSTSL